MKKQELVFAAIITVTRRLKSENGRSDHSFRLRLYDS